ncbi:MAG: FKBP-type peptidyl-prolyl cis-trans isomerase [Bacteroidia bacterium]|nr:FKBP-type peptidyl-prolyl cis-trans isomerase [Bacteroidia bacterium]
MFKTYSYFLLLMIGASFFNSCKNGEDSHEQKSGIDKVKIDQQFIKVNQQVVTKEIDEMDYYQKSHQFPFVKTNFGVRYYVYKPSIVGDSIENGDVVTINYTLTLLDGTICYSSKTDGEKQFKVGMQDVEDGLHKSILKLKKGDKALLLIPSHLAHGLLGDSKKVPPQSPILYDIEILQVSKSSSSNE